MAENPTLTLADVLNLADYGERVEAEQIFQFVDSDQCIGLKTITGSKFPKQNGRQAQYWRLIPWSYELKTQPYFEYDMTIPEQRTKDTKVFLSNASLVAAAGPVQHGGDVAGRFFLMQDTKLPKRGGDGFYKAVLREVTIDEATEARDAYRLSRNGTAPSPVAAAASGQSKEEIILGIVGSGASFTDIRDAVLGSDTLKGVPGLAKGVTTKTLLRDMVKAGQLVEPTPDTFERA